MSPSIDLLNKKSCPACGREIYSYKHGCAHCRKKREIDSFMKEPSGAARPEDSGAPPANNDSSDKSVSTSPSGGAGASGPEGDAEGFIYCPKCGYEISYNARHCIFCGGATGRDQQ